MQRHFLAEDYLIRTIVKDRLRNAGVAGIDIERTRDETKVFIRSNRPGLVIGRGGRGIEDLRALLVEKINALRDEYKILHDYKLSLNVVELRRTELSAPVIAQQIASDVERRLPFRLVMRRHLRFIKQNKEVRGAKLKLSGRLNGSEYARSEHMAFGKMPLHTIRADIDYGKETALTTYGTIGVKVWLYKGEVFSEIENEGTTNS